MKLRKLIENNFSLSGKTPLVDRSVFSDCASHCVALRDSDRIKLVGWILLYLVDHLDEEEPDCLDLFLLGIYPLVYPRIEKSEELSIKSNKCDAFLVRRYEEENNFLFIFTQKQSQVVLDALNLIISIYPYCIERECRMALLKYWEERSKGVTEFGGVGLLPES